MSNSFPDDELPHKKSLDTNWNKHKDQGPPAALAITPAPPGDLETATLTEHSQSSSSVSPVSHSSPLTAISSPEDEITLPQRRRRDKNRVAAARCRKKAKVKTGELQQLYQGLYHKNEILQTEMKELREEVLSLKVDILAHGRCDSVVIQQYIRGAAALAGQEIHSRNESERILHTP